MHHLRKNVTWPRLVTAKGKNWRYISKKFKLVATLVEEFCSSSKDILTLRKTFLYALQVISYAKCTWIWKQIQKWFFFGKRLHQALGNKPLSIRLNSDSEFVIEISCKSKSNIPPTVWELCFRQYKQKIEVTISPS